MKGWPESFLVKVEGREYRIAVRHSQKARRMRLRAISPGVELVVPRRTSLIVAEEFIWSARAWIVAHADKVRTVIEAAEGTTWWRGEEFEVVWGEGKGVCFEEGVVKVGAKSWKEAEAALKKWMIGEVRGMFMEVLARRSAEMGLAFGKVRVGDQRSRWGSCSSRGTVSLNWRLGMVPPEVLDYLVVHELAHLKEMNHSPRFWALVERHCPDYRTHEKWIRQHGGKVMAFGRVSR